MKRSRSGFTIVELLVVIVVIAILAAITIVAYNGIQQRAENIKTISGVNQAVKLLKAYKAINDSYPTSSSYYNCLGTGYPSNTCDRVTSSGAVVVANSSSFDTALATVGSLPQLSTKPLILSTDTVMGASFEQSAKMIRYWLNGASQTCSAGGTGYNYGSTAECRLVLE
jgi:prepilin-type N-terminal cleavage/methylation domain-containing protein